MVKLSNVLIGVIVIFMITAGLNIFLLAGVDKYNKTDYDNTTFSKIQKNYEDMQIIVNTTHNSISATESDRDLVDIVGDFLSQAIGAFKITARSINIYNGNNGIVQSTIDEANIDQNYGNVLIAGIGAIIIIIIIVAIGMEIITKSQRL